MLEVHIDNHAGYQDEDQHKQEWRWCDSHWCPPWQCSAWRKQAGIRAGISIWRLMRCSPWICWWGRQTKTKPINLDVLGYSWLWTSQPKQPIPLSLALCHWWICVSTFKYLANKNTRHTYGSGYLRECDDGMEGVSPVQELGGGWEVLPCIVGYLC